MIVQSEVNLQKIARSNDLCIIRTQTFRTILW